MAGIFRSSIMISGAGHSGSTLLGMILGRANGAFYIGEGAKVRYLGDRSKPLRKRACKACGDACPVWSGFAWEADRPLYPSITAHMRASTIVDSTKNGAWIAERATETLAASASPHLILLLRDGRAVVNSRIRKYPDRDPEAQIRSWCDQIIASLADYDAFPGAKQVVHYEDLATDPATVVGRVCSAFGLPFDEAMLRFEEGQHHPLGGNNGTQFLATRANHQCGTVEPGQHSDDYYRQHQGAIRPDERWRTELSAEHARLFESIAAATNQHCRRQKEAA